MKNTKNINWIVLAVIIISLIVLPLIFRHLFKNPSEDIAYSFYGSYFGAVMGGSIFFLGICLTIHFTSLQNKEERVLAIRPYIDIEYLRTEEITAFGKYLGQIGVSLGPDNENNPDGKPIIKG